MYMLRPMLLMDCVAPISASKETSSGYMDLRMSHRPSPRYELSFGTSLAKVGHSNTSKTYILILELKFV